MLNLDPLLPVVVLYAVFGVAIIVLVILLARLTLVATRTLIAITEERRLRIDLLVAERGDGVE